MININYRPINYSIRSNTLLLIAILLMILSLFAPSASWAIGIILLAATSRFMSKSLRLLLLTTVIFSISVMTSSRDIFSSISDDFTHYYPTFLNINNGDLSAIFNYGKGFEVGLPLYFLLLSSIFGEISPSHLIFFITLLSSVLLVIWLEVFALKNIEKKEQGILVAFVFAFALFIYSSQLCRQYISSIILLFALCADKNKNKFIFLFIASAFHLTAIPIYLIFNFSKRLKFIGLFFVAFLFIFIANNFDTILQNDFILDLAGFDKFSYYNITALDAKIDIRQIFMMTLPMPFVVRYFLVNKINKDASDNKNEWAYFYLFNYFIYIILTPFPLASFRTTLLLNGIILGYIIYIFSDKYHKIISTILIIAYVPWLLKVQMFSDTTTSFALWKNFDQFGLFPGYYFLTN